MLKVLIPVIIVLVVLGALKGKNSGKRREEIRGKLPLTKHEQPMYFRLVEALPEHIVLAQVAFSAIITAREQATRNRFNTKVADFVICTKAFEVLKVIELDDASHKGNEERDAKRDAILETGGLQVLRYKRVPDVGQIKKDVLGNFTVLEEA